MFIRLDTDQATLDIVNDKDKIESLMRSTQVAYTRYPSARVLYDPVQL